MNLDKSFGSAMLLENRKLTWSHNTTPQNTSSLQRENDTYKMEKSIRHHLSLMIKLIINNGQTDIMWPPSMPITGIINDS